MFFRMSRFMRTFALCITLTERYMKLRHFIQAAMLVSATCTAAAQNKKAEFWENFKQNTSFGGYVIGKGGVSDQDRDANIKSRSSFDLRLVRLYVNGKIHQFNYMFQMEMNGVAGTSKEKGPHIADAWIEWSRYDFLKIKGGQFKRAFTFENPMNPWDIQSGAYSQLVDKLAGLNDRVGEHCSNGRDIGLQVQGDLFPSRRDGHRFLHYQIGVYNGQGINHSDANDMKDVIGGLWVAPVKDLNIGVFGWKGNYSKDGFTVDRNRISAGVKYESLWTVRAEYASSRGHKISDYKRLDDGRTVLGGSNRSDAWYILAGAPVTDKCKLYGRWDVFRDAGNFDSQRAIYGAGVNYYFCKNLKVQANYSFIDDKTSPGDQHYNSVDLQIYWRF